MSRSNPETGTQHPCTRWFEWSGSEGTLKWYDRDTKKNNFVTLPFSFLVLDQLNTVGGYSDELGTGFYATEVRKGNETITVFANKRPFKKGIWRDDLEHIKGARFVKSVYIAYFNDEGELSIGNIKFSGAALGGLSDTAIKANFDKAKTSKGKIEAFEDDYLRRIGWFDFAKTCDLYNCAVTVIGSEADSKGATKFFRPVFKSNPVKDETNEQALVLDKELQAYLTEYFKKDLVETAHDTPVAHDDEPVDHVEQYEAEKRFAATATTAVEPEPDFAPLKGNAKDDLDQIPF